MLGFNFKTFNFLEFKIKFKNLKKLRSNSSCTILRTQFQEFPKNNILN